MPRHNVHTLTKEIAKREGKLIGTNIAQISEIVAIVSDLIVTDPLWLQILLNNGIRRKKLPTKIIDPEINTI